MKYGIKTTDTGCDYTVLDSLEECSKWVKMNIFELERNNARYVEIINDEDHDELVFYDNVTWENGVSNLKEIAAKITKC